MLSGNIARKSLTCKHQRAQKGVLDEIKMSLKQEN
jgi:hypothetical protein